MTQLTTLDNLNPGDQIEIVHRGVSARGVFREYYRDSRGRYWMTLTLNRPRADVSLPTCEISSVERVRERKVA